MWRPGVAQSGGQLRRDESRLNERTIKFKQYGKCWLFVFGFGGLLDVVGELVEVVGEFVDLLSEAADVALQFVVGFTAFAVVVLPGFVNGIEKQSEHQCPERTFYSSS